MTAAMRRRIPVAGVTLSVRDEGTGPAALLLHGFTGSGESMGTVAEAIRAGRRVIRPDLVGHGDSDAPRPSGADGLDPVYRMEGCVAQLLGVLDALDVDRADVIGYSMGGRTALSVAAHAPERVRSLALIGASPGLASADERASRIAADEALAARVSNDGVASFVDFWMALPLFASQRRLGEAALAAARADRLRCCAEGLAGSLRGMGTGAMPPLHDRLSSLSMPALLVVGEEDAKFRALAVEMAESLPRAEVVVIEEAGHAAHLEQPAVFGERLRAFLDRVSPRVPVEDGARARADGATR